MRTILLSLVLGMFCSLSFGQSGSLADLNANRYDINSLDNRYGAGSRYKIDGLNNPYSIYGSRYSNQSARNPHATSPPKIYSSSGTYHGEYSTSRYAPDSVSNPYGRFGSRYSSESIRNPYGAGSRYSQQPLYIYPSYGN